MEDLLSEGGDAVCIWGKVGGRDILGLKVIWLESCHFPAFGYNDCGFAWYLSLNFSNFLASSVFIVTGPATDVVVS